MERFPEYTVPTPLYVRALELDLVPRSIPDLASYALPSYYYEDAPIQYAHSIALLAAGELTPEQREQVVRGALGYARRSSSYPPQGVDVYCALIPLLAPQEQTDVREEAQPVLDNFARLVHSRDWEAPWGTLLRYREQWRVLRPDTYDDWLTSECGKLLRYRAWTDTPGPYREHLAHLHLLRGEDHQRAIDIALDGIRAVGDTEVTADREWAFAGGRIYGDDDVDAASRAAQIKVLAALAPFLPPSLHARARALAEERGTDLGDLPGSALKDTWRMRGVLWYHTQPDIPVPWLTPPERVPAFDALDVSTRITMIAQYVEAHIHVTEEFLALGSRRALPNNPIVAQFRRLVDQDLPVASRYLDANQTRQLLTFYQPA